MRRVRNIIVFSLTVAISALCVMLCTISASAADVVDSGKCGDNLTWVLYDDGELVISGEGEMEDVPWYPYNYNITSLTLDDGITSIAAAAFEYSRLSTVTIPDSVTTVGEYAFNGSSLESVSIGKDTTHIEGSAFLLCFNLSRINIDSKNAHYTVIDDVLFSKDMTELVHYPYGKTQTSYTVPKGVTAVGDYAVWGCRLTDVSLPDGIETIGDYAFASFFRNTSQLKSISLPDSIVSIGDYAFYGSRLENITFGKRTSTIGDFAFSECKMLTYVDIPKNTISIGHYAFSSCPNLKEAVILSKTAKMGSSIFGLAHKDFTIYGYNGSTAEAYAEENDIPFTALNEAEPDIVGDITGDGTLNIDDALALFQYSILPDVYPVKYSGGMDFTKDGVVDIDDALLLFQHSMLPDVYPI